LYTFRVNGGTIHHVNSVGGGGGIECGTGMLVEHCMVIGSSGNGFGANGPACVFDHCLSVSNVNGFQAYASNTLIRACQAVGSSSFGYNMYYPQPGINSANSLIDGCTAYGCTTGFSLATNGIIQNCHAANCGTGIQVNNNCLVRNNQCTENSAFGYFVAGAGNQVEDNSSVNDAVGTGFDIAGTGNLVIRNNSRGGAASFSIAAGNSSGPVVNVWNGGAGTNNITSSPWANFGY
jgi:Right handed beta helix region